MLVQELTKMKPETALNIMNADGEMWIIDETQSDERKTDTKRKTGWTELQWSLIDYVERNREATSKELADYECISSVQCQNALRRLIRNNVLIKHDKVITRGFANPHDDKFKAVDYRIQCYIEKHGTATQDDLKHIAQQPKGALTKLEKMGLIYQDGENYRWRK